MLDLYFLIEFPIFRDFDGDDVDALGGLCQELSYGAGEAVVSEGGAGDAMYIVKSGVLEVSRKMAGVSKSINLLSAGEFFGEMALIDGSPRSADVTAKEAAVLVKLPSEAYQRLKKERPATALRIADVLLKTLSFRVRRSTNRALQSEAPPTPPASSTLPARKPARKPSRKPKKKASKKGRRR